MKWHVFTFAYFVNTLFPAETRWPEGFFYLEEFISEVEEKKLYDEIVKMDLHPLLFHGYEARRKVASFGYDWNFQKRVLTRGKEIPGAFRFLIEKVAEKISISPDGFGELLITEYPVGSVINWHRDAPPFDIIAGTSLLAGCTFRFRPYGKLRRNRKEIISLRLNPRSLYWMKGLARSDWEHSIPAVNQLRYSITLRTLK